MIVVSDSGPLHYFIIIGKADLLQTLFGEVLIPRSVWEELTHLNAPVEVRTWMESPPTWVTVALASAHAEPFPLGRGESEAIHLAKERNANLILLDDKKARRVAEEHGLTVTGTLGILLIAHQKGFVEMPAILRDLLRCGFRLSEKLAAQILADLDHHSE